MRVYLNEFNMRMGRLCYLPLVSGILRASAETREEVTDNYEFMPFHYRIDRADTILAAYDAPHVAAFSLSMWNEQLNLAVAAEVKSRWPECLVVFGGPQVPHEPTSYMQQHAFIDIAVRGEGEETFGDILCRHLESRDFSGIPGVSFREEGSGAIVCAGDDRPFQRSLDDYPSPYLEGLYDELIAAQGENLEFQAIIETNRGCPFKCTFCFWGRGGLSRKYRYHSMDRVFAEIDWCGRNGIQYVFNADSNFGMHKRDQEIAEFIVETKHKYGAPDKFRTCFGKNTDDKIFRIGSLFAEHDLCKGVTLARQSNDEDTLKAIKRGNIKMSSFSNLQRRFTAAGVPLYAELILGLPGETVATWERGVDELLVAGFENQLFIYLCQVYPNTELADPAYLEQYGMRTVVAELHEIHGEERDAAWPTEYETLVVATSSMSHDEWQRMVTFSWLTMLMHGMKVGHYILAYLIRRHDVSPSALFGYIVDNRMPEGTGELLRRELAVWRGQLEEMLTIGTGRGHVLPDYGALYWAAEEASFLRVCEDPDQFYAEFHDVLRAFLAESSIIADPVELEEVVRYQRLRMPSATEDRSGSYEFTTNVPLYCPAAAAGAPEAFQHARHVLDVNARDFEGDTERFARETVLWGRKSGSALSVASARPAPSTLLVDPRAANGGAALHTSGH